jgi:hypothetical protein
MGRSEGRITRMISTAITGDLFAWAKPVPAPSKQAVGATTAAPSKIRRTCPFIIGGAPIGGTGDLETLVVDGLKPEETP